jgi:hypothetical protein
MSEFHYPTEVNFGQLFKDVAAVLRDPSLAFGNQKPYYVFQAYTLQGYVLGQTIGEPGLPSAVENELVLSKSPDMSFEDAATLLEQGAPEPGNYAAINWGSLLKVLLQLLPILLAK